LPLQTEKRASLPEMGIARRLFSKPHDLHKGAEKWPTHAMLSGPSTETCCSYISHPFLVTPIQRYINSCTGGFTEPCNTPLDLRAQCLSLYENLLALNLIYMEGIEL